MSRLTRPALAVLASAALAAGTAGLLSPAQAATTRHQLPGSVPSWANAAHKVGASNGTTKVDFRVYLGWKGGDAAQQYAVAASTPGNALYRKFLTPAQFRAKYSPDASQVSAVQSWLKSQGFTLGALPANHKYVAASGTLSTAAAAFGTSFAQYKVNGSVVRANSSPLSVPSSLTGVQAVLGLDQSQTLAVSNTTTPPPPLFKNGTPCSSYWGEKTVQNTPANDGTPLPASPTAWAPCGYAGAQLQGAYGMAGALGNGDNGHGVTVGVIDAYASPTIESDVEHYSSLHGLPSIQGHFRQVVAPGIYNHATNNRHDPGGWSGEETLDIEAVHTMAPGADIVYIGAPNNFRDLDAIMNKVVDGHLADIVTNSYGYAGEALPTGYIKPTLDTEVQAAAEGISLFYSSGDSGDETFGDPNATPTPDFPASSPLITAVGGTSLGVDATNARQFELGWQTTKSTLDKTTTTWNPPKYLYGGGGGTSRLFGQPSYQAGVVPDSMATANGGSTKMRVVPDVAAVGDPTTGMLVGQTQTFPDGHTGYSEYRIGGTSLSSPLYAGMFAVAMQKAGHPFGLANPVLYGAPANDITKTDRAQYPGAVRSDFANGADASDGYVYSARYFDADEALTIHVVPGYDDITGVGSPTGQAWLDYVAAH